MPKILHLVTQHRQPYGSVRKCCEMCGKMCGPYAPTPQGHAWTDDPEAYRRTHEDYISCNEKWVQEKRDA